MKTWNTFGASGTQIVELSLRDIVKLLAGGEVDASSVVLCFGKSKRDPEAEKEKIRQWIRALNSSELPIKGDGVAMANTPQRAAR